MRAALLDNVNHARLKLLTQPQLEFGDGVLAVPTVPAEFRQLQAHFPILFQMGVQDRSVQPLALLGLSEAVNSFVQPQGWDAPYLPWALERQPLLVGRDGEQGWVVHIDLDSPRLSDSEGEALFLPQGGLSPLLQRRVAVLQALHEGLQSLPAFAETLLRLELLEPLNLDVTLPDGSVQRFGGYHVIHEERLAALPGTEVAALHEAGHWLPIAMALASLSQLGPLIEREQRLGHA